MLKNKLSVFGNLDLNAIQEVNTGDLAPVNTAVMKMTLTPYFARVAEIKFKWKYKAAQAIKEISCASCGAKNKVQALFCKKCGTPISKKLKYALR